MDGDAQVYRSPSATSSATPPSLENDRTTATSFDDAKDSDSGMHDIPAVSEAHSKAAEKRMLAGVKRKFNELEGDGGEGDEVDAHTNATIQDERDDGSGDESEDDANENQFEKSERSLRETEDFLLGRLRRRDQHCNSKYRIPRTDIIRWARLKHDKGKSYNKALKELSKEKPTDEQIDRLRRSMRMVPNYLCRTSSLMPGKRFCHKNPTNGFTTSRVMMPAADIHLEFVAHDDLFDLNVGELIYLVAQHLIWRDLNCDELLSWSIDTLFNVMHGLNRYNEGQGGSSLLYLDTRRAKTRKGEDASFVHALRPYEEFKVPSFHGWTGPIQNRLKSRKFTQEYLSHGTIISDDDRFAQAKVETLIQHGLYDIFPELRIPSGQRRTGLYGGLVYYRMIGYPPSQTANAQKAIYSYYDCAREVPLTIEYLEKVRKLTLCFMTKNTGGDQAPREEPHLHIFLSFLTFYKRRRRDQVLMEWIKTHYTEEDLIDIYDDGTGEPIAGFAHAASNLPGVLQYLDLLRDAAWALGIPAIPETVVESQNALTGEVYAKADAKLQRNEVSSRVYVKKERFKKQNDLANSLAQLSGGNVSDAAGENESDNDNQQVENPPADEDDSEDGSGVLEFPDE